MARKVAALLAGYLIQPAAALADTAEPQILVVATPLAGDDGTIEADGAELKRSRAVSVAEQMARTAAGVSVNEIQGNPLQVDLSYRGFTASPLLGTPQGLSVYLDGVRLNQPFGEVVNWDLIPTQVIAHVDVVSGSAPQFGRNALGGTLVLKTRDGRNDPGLSAEASGGSFGRVTAGAKAGGATDSGFDWFLAGDLFREDGWRVLSPSRATRSFAKVGWSDAKRSVSLSGLFANTGLNGNGLQEMRLLAADRRSIYTAPDETWNRAWLFNLKAERAFSGAVTTKANAFWRRMRSATLNGDVNDDVLGQDPYQPTAEEQAALVASGYTGFPVAGENAGNTPFPRWRCIANVQLNAEPNETCNALANRSLTRQSEWGLGWELVARGSLGGIAQSLTLGFSYTVARADFRQTTQFGYLRPDRTVATVDGPGAFADGSQESQEAFDARVLLKSRTRSLGLYVLESAQLLGAMKLDLGGRYDRTAIRNRDGITPGGGTGSLDSNPVYSRFNASAGVTWTLARPVTLALAWSQASRTPSAIELGCSDPESPCRLPNALAGDPPLQQVVARSIEARVNAKGRRWHVSASLFRTVAENDILFVSDDTAGFGYFRNFGRTRRQGLEVEGAAELKAVSLSVSYTLLDATYRSREVVGGAANRASDALMPGLEGTIAIVPGDHIPLIPRHLFKAAVEWRPLAAASLLLDIVASSGVLARGNENGLHAADGVYYLGPGRTDGYVVVNLGLDLHPGQKVTLFVTVRNLFDKDYATAAQLGATAFDAGGRFVAQPFGPGYGTGAALQSSTFYAPGAPRSVQAGLRFRF